MPPRSLAEQVFSLSLPKWMPPILRGGIPAMEWNTSTACDELIYSPTMTQRSPS